MVYRNILEHIYTHSSCMECKLRFDVHVQYTQPVFQTVKTGRGQQYHQPSFLVKKSFLRDYCNKQKLAVVPQRSRGPRRGRVLMLVYHQQGPQREKMTLRVGKPQRGRVLMLVYHQQWSQRDKVTQ